MIVLYLSTGSLTAHSAALADLQAAAWIVLRCSVSHCTEMAIQGQIWTAWAAIKVGHSLTRTVPKHQSHEWTKTGKVNKTKSDFDATVIIAYLNVLRKENLKNPNKNDLLTPTLVSFQRSLHAAEAEGEDSSVPACADVLQQFDGAESPHWPAAVGLLACRGTGRDRAGQGGKGQDSTGRDRTGQHRAGHDKTHTQNDPH